MSHVSVAILAGAFVAWVSAPLAIVLRRLRAVLEDRLGADALGLVLVEPDGPVVSGADRLSHYRIQDHQRSHTEDGKGKEVEIPQSHRRQSLLH